MIQGWAEKPAHKESRKTDKKIKKRMSPIWALG